MHAGYEALEQELLTTEPSLHPSRHSYVASDSFSGACKRVKEPTDTGICYGIAADGQRLHATYHIFLPLLKIARV